MGDGNFITIGGVRYHKDSVVSHSVTTNKNGTKRYNVTLEGGTRLSYNKQAKSSQGYEVKSYNRRLIGSSITVGDGLGLDRSPLVLADKPSLSPGAAKKDVAIEIFGLNNATITGSSKVRENVSLNNCHNNKLKFTDGDSFDYIDVRDTDGIKPSTNNSIFVDSQDEVNISGEKMPKNKRGNKVKYTKF